MVNLSHDTQLYYKQTFSDEPVHSGTWSTYNRLESRRLFPGYDDETSAKTPEPSSSLFPLLNSLGPSTPPHSHSDLTHDAKEGTWEFNKNFSDLGTWGTTWKGKRKSLRIRTQRIDPYDDTLPIPVKTWKSRLQFLRVLFSVGTSNLFNTRRCPSPTLLQT